MEIESKIVNFSNYFYHTTHYMSELFRIHLGGAAEAARWPYTSLLKNDPTFVRIYVHFVPKSFPGFSLTIYFNTITTNFQLAQNFLRSSLSNIEERFSPRETKNVI